ncbi:MAG: hypothetical protein IJ272_04925 [Clostridia bacterium]|nr:hypothetical protein [Clostridia bacterium]
MKTNTRENYLKKRLLFWFIVLAIAIAIVCLINVAYSASTTTYTSTHRMPEVHQKNIAFMESNRDSSMNTFIHKYTVEDGKYIIGFAVVYNLASLIAIAGCALAIRNVYCCFARMMRDRYDKDIRKSVKHTAAMHKFRTEMRYERGRKNVRNIH